jgi:FkbM family methyltransferase
MKAIYYPEVSFKVLCIPEILKEIYIDRVFAKLKPCNVILDVGANIGLTAMYLKDFGKRVYAIEPATDLLESLYQNIKSFDNVAASNIAISDKNCTCSLYLNDENRTMNSLVWNTGKGETVECKTFAQFMTEHRIEEVDFCKLDVEGAEEAILLGEGFTNVANRIKSLLVEFHDRNKVQTLLDHMFHLGYKVESVPATSMLYWFEQKRNGG